jgi:DNA methylase
MTDFENTARRNAPPFRDLVPHSVDLDRLLPLGQSTRRNSDRQIRKFALNLDAFGQVMSVLITAENEIIAGECTVEAARLLGWSHVLAVSLTDLNESEARQVRLAHYRLEEDSEWNREALAIEFREIEFLTPDVDLTLTGFELAEIDLIFQGAEKVVETPAEAVVEPDRSKPASTQPGDLVILGDHKVFCGDALVAANYEALMDGDHAQLVISDFPFNVPFQGHIGGKGKVQHSDFAMASGEMTPAEFTAFLRTAMDLMVVHSLDGSLHYFFMDWRHMFELLAAGHEAYSVLKNLCIWNKTNGGMGSFYRSKHELVFVFKSGTEPHINNIALGKWGRNRTNVWDYAGMNSFGSDRSEELAMHPTVKPVEMIADAILDASHRGDIVLDPFGGSGSTLLAAEQTGRRARLMEIDPYYVDLIVERFERATSKTAERICAGGAR